MSNGGCQQIKMGVIVVHQIHKVIASSHPSVDPGATLEMILGLRFIIPSFHNSQICPTSKGSHSLCPPVLFRVIHQEASQYSTNS